MPIHSSQYHLYCDSLLGSDMKHNRPECINFSLHSMNDISLSPERERRSMLPGQINFSAIFIIVPSIKLAGSVYGFHCTGWNITTVLPRLILNPNVLREGEIRLMCICMSASVSETMDVTNKILEKANRC